MDYLNVFQIIRNLISCLSFLIGMGSGVFLIIRKQRLAGLLMISGFFLFSLDTIAEFVVFRILYNHLLYYGEHREEVNQVLDYLYLCISTPAFFFGSIALAMTALTLGNRNSNPVNIRKSNLNTEFERAITNSEEVVNITAREDQTYISRTASAGDQAGDVNKFNPNLLNVHEPIRNAEFERVNTTFPDKVSTATPEENQAGNVNNLNQDSVDFDKFSRDISAGLFRNLRKLAKVSIRLAKYVKNQFSSNQNLRDSASRQLNINFDEGVSPAIKQKQVDMANKEVLENIGGEVFLQEFLKEKENMNTLEDKSQTENSILELLKRQNDLLENIRNLMAQSLEKDNEKTYTFRSRIIDIDMSVGAMITLSFKWLIASIPVGMVIGFLMLILNACSL